MVFKYKVFVAIISVTLIPIVQADLLDRYYDHSLVESPENRTSPTEAKIGTTSTTGDSQQYRIRLQEPEDMKSMAKRPIPAEVQDLLLVEARSMLVGSPGRVSQRLFTANLTEEETNRIRRHPFVTNVSPITTASASLNTSTDLIKADNMYNITIEDEPLEGADETICVLDTGVDYTHPSFGSCSLSPPNTTQVNSSVPANYSDNLLSQDTVQVTGWDRMQVYFSSVDTEGLVNGRLQDYIVIESPDGNVVDVLYGEQTGVWSAPVEGDTVNITFVSDGDNNAYGGYNVTKARENTPLNGCPGVVGGYDYVNDDADPADDDGHGTHVTGTAVGDGLPRGVAPEAAAYHVKVLDDGGLGSFTDIRRGVDLCTKHHQELNISTVSMSLGSERNYSVPCDGQFPFLSESVNTAAEHNLTVVASSGNSGTDQRLPSPACLANVTPVAATTDNDNVWEGSNLDEAVSVAAPGKNIDAPSYMGGYVEKTGTSMAAPHVGAAVALLEQTAELADSSVSPIPLLNRTGTRLTDDAHSVSRINILDAVRRVLPQRVDVSYDAVVNATEAIEFSITPSVPAALQNVTVGGVNTSQTNDSYGLSTNTTALNVSEGDHNITVKYRWTDNETLSEFFPLTVDNTSPSVSFHPPTNTTSWEQNISVSYNVTDATNVTSSLAPRTAVIPTNTTVNATFTDEANNTLTKHLYYPYNAPREAINLTAPRFSNSYQPTIRYDNTSANCNASVGTTPIGLNQKVDPTRLSEGVNNLSVACYNQIGQNVTFQRNLTVDVTPPYTRIKRSTNGTIHLNVSDRTKTTTYYEYGNVSDTGTTIRPEKNTSYSIEYYSVDSANNTEFERSSTIIVDNQPPNITVTSPLEQPSNTSIRVTASVSDQNPTDTIITLDNTTRHGETASFPPQPNGTYNATVTSTDRYNQTSTITRTINITTSPYVNVNTSNNTVFGDQLTVNLTAVADNVSITSTCFDATTHYNHSPVITCTAPASTPSYPSNPPFDTGLNITANATTGNTTAAKTYEYQHDPTEPTINVTHPSPLRPNHSIIINTTGDNTLATLLNQTETGGTDLNVSYTLPLSNSKTVDLTVSASDAGGTTRKTHTVTLNTTTETNQQTSGDPNRSNAKLIPQDPSFDPYIQRITGLNVSNVSLSTTPQPGDARFAYNISADTARQSVHLVTLPSQRLSNASAVYFTANGTTLPTTHRGNTTVNDVVSEAYYVTTDHYSTFYATVNTTNESTEEENSDDPETSSDDTDSSGGGTNSGGGGIARDDPVNVSQDQDTTTSNQTVSNTHSKPHIDLRELLDITTTRLNTTSVSVSIRLPSNHSKPLNLSLTNKGIRGTSQNLSLSPGDTTTFNLSAANSTIPVELTTENADSYTTELTPSKPRPDFDLQPVITVRDIDYSLLTASITYTASVTEPNIRGNTTLDIKDPQGTYTVTRDTKRSMEVTRSISHPALPQSNVTVHVAATYQGVTGDYHHNIELVNHKAYGFIAIVSMILGTLGFKIIPLVREQLSNR